MFVKNIFQKGEGGGSKLTRRRMVESVTLMVEYATLMVESVTLMVESATLMVESAALMVESVTLMVESAALMVNLRKFILLRIILSKKFSSSYLALE